MVIEDTVEDEVIDNLCHVGYCVVVIGDESIYSKNEGVITARLPFNLGLADFQNDLQSVKDNILSLMSLNAEKQLTADAIINLEIDLEELSRIAAEKPCHP
jgi:uncharacterized protein YbjQ (UPF0145 family)